MNDIGPYKFQRWRSSAHSAFPRPPQPNTSQPNHKSLTGWGMSTQDYWGAVFESYLNRRTSQRTSLALGRI